MRRASFPLAFGTLLCLAAGAAQGFGFGRASSPTVLGQNLNFTTVVRVEPDESLVPECIVAEVIAGDNRLATQSVRVSVEPGGTASERLLRVTSTVSIDEPVVTVNLTLGCTNRISRRFVAFIDPPSVNLAQSSIVESSPSEPARVDASSTPTVAVVQASPTTVAPAKRAGSAAPDKPKPAARAPARKPVVVAEGAPVPGPGPTRKVEAAAPSQARPGARAPGPRLQLEAAPPVAARGAASGPATAAGTPPIAAAALPPASSASSIDSTVALLTEQSENLAKERARLAALEESLNRLRAESQATQTTLVALQARLKTAEAERYTNPLVYALGLVSAGLAVAVLMLWWRLSRSRRDGQWWAQPKPQAVEDDSADDGRTTTPPTPSQSLSPPTPAKRAPVITAPAPDSALPVWADSRLTEAPPDMVPEPRRDLSVEELIDLEQQAEFFVVLGQDEAAIDLLMGHVRSTGGISPLPYLKLLEIYKRRGDRSAYERIRERFNRRFNAYAPDWDTDLQQGKSLEDYPATMVKLEGLWGMPQRVMETLDASLFRRDETEVAYDLPAYRELLFLYSVARDFTTRAAAEANSGSVDLLLPMDSSEVVPATRLSASTRAQPRDSEFGSATTLDMEMTSPMPVDLEPPRRYERSAPPDLSLNSDFLDLPELPTGPGKLPPTDKR